MRTLGQPSARRTWAGATHPAVIVDGMIHENPYYIEPGAFLSRTV
jgi:hypothetical protein